MKRTQTAIMALLLFAGFASAQTPPSGIEIIGKHSLVDFDRIIVVKEKKLVIDEIPFKLKAPESDGFLFIWELPAGVSGNKSSDGKLLEVTAAPKGQVTIGLQIAVIEDGKGKSINYATTFIVGGVPAPVPVPPNPPLPPDVKPPVPVAGLRVLVVAEATTAGLLKFTQEQINELYGEQMNEYNRSKLAKGPDGTPEIRRIDKDSDPAKMSEVWRAFYNVWKTEANGAAPWIVVSNGRTGFSGPLPNGNGKILELVKRYEQ